MVSLALGSGVTVASEPQRRKRNSPAVIMVWLEGGPPNREWLDALPKSADRILRGDFNPIPASIRGDNVLISELWPKLAKVLDRTTLLRTVNTTQAAHEEATKAVLLREGETISATMGTKYAEPNSVPTVFMPMPSSGGFSPAHDKSVPVTFTPHPNLFELAMPRPDWGMRVDRGQWNSSMQGLKGEWDPSKAKADPRLAQRVSLLSQLQNQQNSTFPSPQADRMRRHQDQAAKLYLEGFEEFREAIYPTGDRIGKFERTVTRYGEGRVAEAFAYAGNLINDAGVGFVTVHMHQFEGFDMHSDLSNRMKKIAPTLDTPLAALLEDVTSGTLNAVVVVMGEFGRAPRMSRLPTKRDLPPGRDHWPAANCVLLAGGKIPQGHLYGKTSPMLEPESPVPVTLLPSLIRAGVEGSDKVDRVDRQAVRDILGTK